MNIIGREILEEYAQLHPNARSSIEDWIATMEASDFQTSQMLKSRFSSVDFLAKNHCLFNINGNHHRLFVKVVYVAGNILVKWIGTHAEYDKIDFTKRAQGQ